MTKKQKIDELTPEEIFELEQLENSTAGTVDDWGSAEEKPVSSKDMPKAESFEDRKKRLAAELKRKEEEMEALENELLDIEEAEYLAQVQECADFLESRGVYAEDLSRYIDHTKDKKLSGHPFDVRFTKKFREKDAAIAAASTGAKTMAPKATATKPASPPKYFNPANHAETWSGRGAEPAWATPFRLGTGNPRFYSGEIDIAIQTKAGTYKPA